MIAFSDGYLVVVSTHLDEIGEEIFSGRFHNDTLIDIALWNISSDIYKAVNDSLDDGLGTIDIIKDKKHAMSTTDFTDYIIDRYRAIVKTKLIK